MDWITKTRNYVYFKGNYANQLINKDTLQVYFQLAITYYWNWTNKSKVQIKYSSLLSHVRAINNTLEIIHAYNDNCYYSIMNGFSICI